MLDNNNNLHVALSKGRANPDYSGDLELARYLAGTAGVNALSGIKGLSTMPGNIVNQGWDKGMDQTADDIVAYQAKYGPSDELSPAGVDAVQHHLAPAVVAIKSIPGVHQLGELSDAYGQGTQEWADLANRVAGPRAAGVAGAIGDTVPMLIGGDGLLAKYASKAADAPKAIAKTMVPTSEADLSGLAPSHFSPPDNAVSFLAHDPATGQVVGHVTAAPRGGAMQSIRMDVDPAYRGQGIGPSLLQDAVGYAHGNGMPYHSDTRVSASAARAYEKLKGVNLSRNPAVDVAQDDFDGTVGMSANGQPVYSIHPATDADSASLDEPMPNGSLATQSYADGGEAEPVLGAVAHLLKQYADKPQAVENFKAWHGNSQVPGVVYHSTAAVPEDFPVFQTTKTHDIGSHFGTAGQARARSTATSTYVSDIYGGQDSTAPARTIPVYLSIQNPLRMPDLGAWGSSDITNWLLKNPQEHKVDMSQVLTPDALRALYGPDIAQIRMHNLKSSLQDAGYDGIVYKNIVEDRPSGADSYIAFEPNQIKSAVGNNGNFDPNDPDFTKARGGVVHMADGGKSGEIAPVVGVISHLPSKSAVPNVHAAQVADKLAETGRVTYSPSSGDLPHEGYLIPHPNSSRVFDSNPTAQEIHDFMIDQQDALLRPSSVLHAETIPGGAVLHSASSAPTFDEAMAAARSYGAPGVREIHTGTNFPATDEPIGFGQGPSDAENEYANDNNGFSRNYRVTYPHDTLPGLKGNIGNLSMEAPKAYLYGEAANTPEIGNQTGSLGDSEVTTYAPHYREKIAHEVGLESVPAQALQWAVYAPQTGVSSGIGMPKLELMTNDIQNVADRYGISPEDARDHYLMWTRPPFPGTQDQ